MKLVSKSLILTTTALSIAVACGDSGTTDDDTATGGTSSGGTVSTGGSVSTGGTSTGGTATGGTATGGTATGGTAMGGLGGEGGEGTGGEPSGDEPFVVTCGEQTYTPAVTDGACDTINVPSVPVIADFETGAAGWGIYGTGGSTSIPASFTEGALVRTDGGPGSSTKTVHYVGTGFAGGFTLEVGYGTTCQDVKAFTGLSFWAKAEIDAETGGWGLLEDQIAVIVLKNATQVDKRVVLSDEWREYRIPFDCLGTGQFNGYLTKVQFVAHGVDFDFAIDDVSFYTDAP